MVSTKRDCRFDYMRWRIRLHSSNTVRCSRHHESFFQRFWSDLRFLRPYRNQQNARYSHIPQPFLGQFSAKHCLEKNVRRRLEFETSFRLLSFWAGKAAIGRRKIIGTASIGCKPSILLSTPNYLSMFNNRSGLRPVDV